MTHQGTSGSVDARGAAVIKDGSGRVGTGISMVGRAGSDSASDTDTGRSNVGAATFVKAASVTGKSTEGTTFGKATPNDGTPRLCNNAPWTPETDDINVDAGRTGLFSGSTTASVGIGNPTAVDDRLATTPDTRFVDLDETETTVDKTFEDDGSSTPGKETAGGAG